MQRIKSATHLTDEDDDTCPSEEHVGEPPRVRQRLIIAANRLPISAQRKPDGKWGLNQSAGGLVSALSGVGNNYEMLWVGWPGVFVEEGPDRDALTQLCSAAVASLFTYPAVRLTCTTTAIATTFMATVSLRPTFI